MMTPHYAATTPLAIREVDRSLIGERMPWSAVNAKTAARLLEVDPATFNTWRYRGKGPPALPKRRRSRQRMYRLSAILVWISSRAGYPLREEDIWRDFLREVGCEQYADSLDADALLAFLKRISPTADLGPCEV